MLDRWRARGATLEAMAGLAAARVLIATVPFKFWRGLLGDQIMPESGLPGEPRPANPSARRLAVAVDRAAARLPGVTKCLPRAMALQWLLHRRGLDATLVIGVKPGAARGGLDDLHAWVVSEGEVVIGASDVTHRPLFAATRSSPPA